MRRLALRINCVNSQGITSLGGLGIWLAFFVIYLLDVFTYGRLNSVGWGLILGSSLIVAFGIIDDYKKELSVPLKFLVQIAATILLVLFGIKTQIVYIGPYLNLLITFIWVLGITNAFNHLDILDGLAGGIAAICLAAFFVIASFNADFTLGMFSLALLGIVLSFLRYNLSATKVYMGNSGSHFLGFVLAAIAIGISYAPMERKIALFSPILVLGLPVFDTSLLIFMRLRKRRSIFNKSNDHCALRLLALGYSKKKTLIIMWLLGLFFSLSGVIISLVANEIGVMVLLVAMAAYLILGKKVSCDYAKE